MISLKKNYNEEGLETGAVITAIFSAPTTLQQKTIIENQLIDYAFSVLYPIEGINIYRDMYVDTPSVTIIRNINNLQSQSITLEHKLAKK